jgi:phage shock protein E
MSRPDLDQEARREPSLPQVPSRARTARRWWCKVAGTVAGLLAVLGLGACTSTTASVQHMTPAAFSTAMSAPGTVLLDVRTPAEYAAGHLLGARNLDIEGSGFATQIAGLDKNATYAVYCHSGNRSGAALEQMAAAGFTHLYDLAGGLMAWQAMGGHMVAGGP